MPHLKPLLNLDWFLNRKSSFYSQKKALPPFARLSEDGRGSEKGKGDATRVVVSGGGGPESCEARTRNAHREGGRARPGPRLRLRQQQPHQPRPKAPRKPPPQYHGKAPTSLSLSLSLYHTLLSLFETYFPLKF